MVSNEGEATSLIIHKSTSQITAKHPNKSIIYIIKLAAGRAVSIPCLLFKKNTTWVARRCGNSTEAMAFRELSIRLY